MRDVRTRLLRALGRSRPERVPHVLCAAARAEFPDARADVFVHEGVRGWRAVAALPLGSLPHVPAPGTRRSSRLPRKPEARDLAAEAPRLPGDAFLHGQGLRWRLTAPITHPGRGRALLSLSRGTEPFDPSDAPRLARLASAGASALWTRARLERSRRALARARLAERLVSDVARSLELEQLARALARRLRAFLPLGRLVLVIVARDGRELETLQIDETHGLDVVETARHAGVARFARLTEPLRSLEWIPDLGRHESTSEWLASLREDGQRSAVVLPLDPRGRFVGALVVATRVPGGLAREHLRLLQLAGRQAGSTVERLLLVRQAAERSRQMTALYEVAQALASPADTAGVTGRVLEILHDTFRFRHSAILTREVEDGEDWLVVQASRGYSLRAAESESEPDPDERVDAHDAAPFRMRVGERGITSRAVRTGRLVYVPDVRRDPGYVQGVESGRSEVAVPLEASGRVIGVLDVESTRLDAFSPEDLDTLRLFSAQVALALERARVFEDVRRQAMTDALTGLWNQRSFNEKVEREIDRSRRTGRPFVLVLADVDDFKRVNDVHGHVAGNRAIVAVGDIMRRRIRSIDAAARFGGDEFALVLSEADEEAARRVVEDLQADLRSSAVPGIGRLTCSLGYAQWTPAHASVRDLVASADAALYRAKALGKDRAVAARELSAEQGAERSR